jgi:hypothetical protein
MPVWKQTVNSESLSRKRPRPNVRKICYEIYTNITSGERKRALAQCWRRAEIESVGPLESCNWIARLNYTTDISCAPKRTHPSRTWARLDAGKRETLWWSGAGFASLSRAPQMQVKQKSHYLLWCWIRTIPRSFFVRTLNTPGCWRCACLFCSRSADLQCEWRARARIESGKNFKESVCGALSVFVCHSSSRRAWRRNYIDPIQMMSFTPWCELIFSYSRSRCIIFVSLR